MVKQPPKQTQNRVPPKMFMFQKKREKKTKKKKQVFPPWTQPFRWRFFSAGPWEVLLASEVLYDAQEALQLLQAAKQLMGHQDPLRSGSGAAVERNGGQEVVQKKGDLRALGGKRWKQTQVFSSTSQKGSGTKSYLWKMGKPEALL